MKILVVGAGGLGGYFGGLLAKTGEDVWFVARGRHLEALRKHGLTVHSVHGDFAVQVNATDRPEDARGAELILLCVKTYDTEAAMAGLAPAAGKGSIILPLQNGVESADKVGGMFGYDRVLGGLAYLESFVAAPGVIEQRSQIRRIEFGELNGAETDRAREVREVLTRADIDCRLRPDIARALWEKLAWIAAGSGMTALARSPIGEVLAFPPTREMFVSAAGEVGTVAEALGIRLDPGIADRTLKFALSLSPTLKTSMQRDVERGGRLEVDALNGAVVRIGARLSVHTPVNGFVYDVLKLEDEKNRLRRAAS